MSQISNQTNGSLSLLSILHQHHHPLDHHRKNSIIKNYSSHPLLLLCKSKTKLLFGDKLKMKQTSFQQKNTQTIQQRQKQQQKQQNLSRPLFFHHAPHTLRNYKNNVKIRIGLIPPKTTTRCAPHHYILLSPLF